MIYALTNGHDGLVALLKHKRSNMNVDKIETDWWDSIEKKLDGVRGMDRVEKRLELANKTILEPEETINDCFIQYLVQKHNFKRVSFKECQVIA